MTHARADGSTWCHACKIVLPGPLTRAQMLAVGGSHDTTRCGRCGAVVEWSLDAPGAIDHECPTEDEFESDEEPLAWEGEGWEEFATKRKKPGTP